MRWLNVLAFLSIGAVLFAAEDKPRVFHFTKDDVGTLPKGWKADHTGKGEGSVWKVEADKTAPSGDGFVLAQTAEGPNPYFNLCIAEDTRYQDVALDVAFKALRGKLDQGGGVVWRYSDGDNYYIARMNPLEDNFRVYKVVKGKRIMLKTKEELKVGVGEWHRIKVTMKASGIECFLDGKKYLEASDDTFKEAGKVGLWSKADAQSRFDSFTVSGK